MIKEKGYSWKAGITSKSFLPKEEMKRLCGLLYDEPLDNERIEEIGDSLYEEYKNSRGLEKIVEIQGIILSWQQWMNDSIEQQECSNCWAHAATGVAEGLLHFRYGTNIEIDLDEMDITNNASCGNCSGTHWIPCGLDYMYDEKVRSEQDLNTFPNYDHGYWTVSNWSCHTVSISEIQNSLNSSPVLGGMTVYEDFIDYTGGIYEHTAGSFLGYHAIVIIGYGNEGGQDYWICKNSWGDDWGEFGYFRIAFGECGIDNQHGNYTASVNHDSCYAKLVPESDGFMDLIDAVDFWTADDEWCYGLNNVTISNGTTLTIPQKFTLALDCNCGLTVNGKLEATNVTFDRSGSSGSWSGIKFNSGSSGSLNMCKIYHSSHAITCNGVLPSISNCDFRYYNVGLILNNLGTPSTHITNNSFYGSGSSQAIACYYSSPYIDGSESYFSLNSMGIFSLGSSPRISYCEFTNNSYGLYALQYGAPYIDPYNRMIDSYAINASNYTHVQISRSDVWARGVRGSAVTASNYAVVVGPYVYWGEYPPSAINFYAINGAQVYYQPGAISPYTWSLSKATASLIESRGEFVEDFINTDESTENWFDEKLLEAAEMLVNGKYDDALDFYKYEYDKAKSLARKRYILSQIAECYRAAGRKDFTSYLNTEIHKNLSNDDELYAVSLELENLFLIPAHDYTKAIDNLITLKTRFAHNKNTLKNALFNLGYVYSVLLSNETKGQEFYDELKTKFPDDLLTWQTKLISGEIDSIPSAILFKNEIPEESVTSASYALLRNYPNPFNPKTTISFDLPEDARVELVVYDLMGREVWKSTKTHYSAGTYSVVWNGTNHSGQPVGTGMYLVRLNSAKYNATQKVLLVK